MLDNSWYRRSAISNCNSNSTLLGTTPIPAELGQTVTGAISNLYSGQPGGWTYIGSCSTSAWTLVSTAYNINSFNEILVLLTVTGRDYMCIASNYADLREIRSINSGLTEFYITAKYHNNNTDWGSIALYTDNIYGWAGDTGRPIVVYGR